MERGHTTKGKADDVARLAECGLTANEVAECGHTASDGRFAVKENRQNVSYTSKGRQRENGQPHGLRAYARRNPCPAEPDMQAARLESNGTRPSRPWVIVRLV